MIYKLYCTTYFLCTDSWEAAGGAEQVDPEPAGHEQERGDRAWARLQTGVLRLDPNNKLYHPRRRNRQKRRQRSSLLSGGRRDYFKKRFWKNIHFRAFWDSGGLVWCEPDDHPFFWNIHTSRHTFFRSSFSSNHPGAKSVLRHGIEWIPSPKQQRRLLLLLICLFHLLLPINVVLANRSYANGLHQCCLRTALSVAQLYLTVDVLFC